MASIISIDQLKKSLDKCNLIDKNKKQASNQPMAPRSGHLPYNRKLEMISKFVIGIQEVLAISDRHHFGEHFICYQTINYIMKYAFIDYPIPGINYEKVLVSRGNLWNTQRAMAKGLSSAISFTWADDSGVGGANQNDKCILVAYCESLNKCLFSKQIGERYYREVKLMAPGFRSHKLQTWLGFISADGTRIANSIYTGEVIIT